MQESCKYSEKLAGILRELENLSEICDGLLIAPCAPSNRIATGWIVFYQGYEIGTIEPRIVIESSYFQTGKVADIKYIFRLNPWISEALKVLEIPLEKAIEEDRIDYLFSILYNTYIPALKEVVGELLRTLVNWDEIPF